MAWQTTACRVFLVVAMTVLVGELRNVTKGAGNQWPPLSDADLDKMWDDYAEVDADVVEAVVDPYYTANDGDSDAWLRLQEQDQDHDQDQQHDDDHHDEHDDHAEHDEYDEHDDDQEELHDDEEDVEEDDQEEHYPHDYEDDPVEDQKLEEQYISPRSWGPVDSVSSRELNLQCSDDAFTFSMHSSPITDVKVVGAKTMLVNASEMCGYSVRPYKNTIRVPYTGCHVKAQKGQYTLKLSYITVHGRSMDATLSCTDGTYVPNMPKPKAGDARSTSNYTGSPKTMAQNMLNPRGGPYPQCSLPLTGTAQNCHVVAGEQVECGYGLDKATCVRQGCCFDPHTFCHYPLNECTVDGQFSFTIRADSASVPVDTQTLFIPTAGTDPDCNARISNPNVAVYTFPLTSCGSRSYVVGGFLVYMVQVFNHVGALDLKYGAIASVDAVRFMIECRCPQSTSNLPLGTVTYQVTIPALQLPMVLTSQGRYRVQLRIATDGSFKNYYSGNSLPLRILLNQPVHLEVNLLAQKRGFAALVVNYCVAFPRDVGNVLVLVFEGCANANNPGTAILTEMGDPNVLRQKRFSVLSFQFINVLTNTFIDEEIFFMCSTDVCLKEPCAAGCFAPVY